VFPPHPVAFQDQSSPPGELQMYVLPSAPHVVWPQFTVTGPLTPAPEHVQAHPVALIDQSLPPGELHMYVFPSVPHVV
jgi:hypothetical protein